MKRIPSALAGLLMIITATIVAAEPSLTVERKIPLGTISGRIDHLAIDVARRRLYVAELGNNTVGIVDLTPGKVLQTVATAHEPQGIAYDANGDVVYVASGDEGSVSLYKGADFSLLTKIKLGDDADNVRIDRNGNRAWVGYGAGALAAIDLKSHVKVMDIPLQAHPESFQLDPNGSLMYVNVPNTHEIAVVDRAAKKQIASWPMKALRSNYPLAFDFETNSVLAVFRNPATLVALSAKTGDVVAQVAICGDSDDVFVDSKRRRVYVICGEGFVDVFARENNDLKRIDHIPTSSGARTGLFVPELDRLFVAARKSSSEGATLWVLKPSD